MWEQRDEIVLCIVRKLGACRDPLDTQWLAQLEGESIEDSGIGYLFGKKGKGKQKVDGGKPGVGD